MDMLFSSTYPTSFCGIAELRNTESEFADKHRLGEDWIKGVTINLNTPLIGFFTNSMKFQPIVRAIDIAIREFEFLIPHMAILPHFIKLA